MTLVNKNKPQPSDNCCAVLNETYQFSHNPLAFFHRNTVCKTRAQFVKRSLQLLPKYFLVASLVVILLLGEHRNHSIIFPRLYHQPFSPGERGRLRNNEEQTVQMSEKGRQGTFRCSQFTKDSITRPPNTQNVFVNSEFVVIPTKFL